MPYKDRAARLAYLAAYRAKHRPAPVAEAQSDGDLPARGRIEFSADGARVRCHVCGRWLGSLNAHLRTHGLDEASYKELYDIARTASLWPPQLKAKQRAAAIERDQGAVGRAHIPPSVGRPKGIGNRLSVKIEAHAARAGINTRSGKRTRKPGD